MRTVFLAVCLSLASCDTVAVCLLGDYTIRAEFSRSDVIAIARVEKSYEVPDEGNWYEGTNYGLTLLEVLKGKVPDGKLTVFSENSSGRFPMEVNSTYLVFISTDLDRNTIDNCGNSALVAASSDAIKEVKELVRQGI